VVTVGVRLPCFRLAASLRHAVDPDAAAFLIERFGRRRVLEATAAAELRGVRPGMTVREAARAAPRAAVAVDDPVRAARDWRRVLDRLARLPAPVEDGGPGMAFVRTPRGDSAARWFGTVHEAMEPLGLHPRCGAGPTKLIAFIATHRGGDAVCRPGAEATFLADAPLDLVCVDPDVMLRLRLIGVRTFGELAALPPHQLRRFGPDVVTWHQATRGELTHAEDTPIYGGN
jgi:nucleotidyltransferase/DNA polymerase involved in DNA repair